MPRHNTIVSFPNSISTMPYMYIKTYLVSQLLHLTPLHFSEHPMNLQFEVIATTNINFQLLHSQLHSFEADLNTNPGLTVLKTNMLPR